MIFERNKPVNLKEGDDPYFQPYYRREIPEGSVKCYRYAYVNSDFVLFKRSRFLEESYYLKKNLERSRFIQVKFAISEIRSKAIRDVAECAWVTDIWSHNYFHWQVDCLQRIFQLQNLLDCKLRLLLPAAYKNIPYITDSLETLGILPTYFCPEELVKVSNLSVPYFFWPPGAVHNGLIGQSRDAILRALKLEPAARKRRIYISRQNAEKRKVVNNGELRILFDRFKIECIVMEELSWKEQVELAYNSELIIGLHGAGLANMMYMTNGSVLELRMENSYDQWCYYELASALGHKYSYCLCEPSSDNKDPYSGDIKVDTVKIEGILDQLLKHDNC